MDMSELEREEVLAGRQAERAKFDEKRQLDAMFRSRQGEAPAGVAGAAKRTYESNPNIYLPFWLNLSLLAHLPES
jgi:hypothetical protein